MRFTVQRALNFCPTKAQSFCHLVKKKKNAHTHAQQKWDNLKLQYNTKHSKLFTAFKCIPPLGTPLVAYFQVHSFVCFKHLELEYKWQKYIPMCCPEHQEALSFYGSHTTVTPPTGIMIPLSVIFSGMLPFPTKFHPTQQHTLIKINAGLTH